MTTAMKKILLGAVLVIAIGGFVYWSASHGSSVTATDTTSAPLETTNPNGNQTSSAPYKDGTYTGSAANSIYGDVQVSATITGGKITDVQFLKYPNDRPNSVQISNSSLPKLKSETIAAQNANVDVVTGATQTSEAFVQTLQSALSQASNS